MYNRRCSVGTNLKLIVWARGHTVHEPTTPWIRSLLTLFAISLGDAPEVMPIQVKKINVKMGAQKSWSITTCNRFHAGGEGWGGGGGGHHLQEHNGFHANREAWGGGGREGGALASIYFEVHGYTLFWLWLGSEN